MKKIALSWIICVLALVGLFAWLGNRSTTQTEGAGSGEALIRADFTLQGAGGKTVRAEDLRGKYLLVYFGFTHCPDICPTTLLMMNNAIGQLGDISSKIQPIFITVDPERDTPQLAADYASHFGKNFLGLSGSAEQIKLAADNFKVFYSKVEDKGSALGYVVDHSGFIYLMGPDGEYLAHFASNTGEQELLKGLKDHVQ